MYGASKDAKEIQEAQTVFEHVIQKIDEGQTGLLLIAEEEDNRPLNQLVMFDLGGEITRLDSEEVQQEINDANEVANEAKQSWQAKRTTQRSNIERRIRSKDCFLNKGKQSFKILRNHGFYGSLLIFVILS